MGTKKPVWKPPTSLLLFGERVPVFVEPDPTAGTVGERHVTDGYWDEETGTIHVREQPPRRMFLTLWHEVFHGTLGQTQLKPMTDAEEEAICDAVSKVVVKVLASNGSMRTPP